jgi:glycosyltransferase involved in cell wall biosynthesis
MNRPKPEINASGDGSNKNERRPNRKRPRPERPKKSDSIESSVDAKSDSRHNKKPRNKSSMSNEGNTSQKDDTRKDDRPIRKKGKPKYSNKPLISVVIPTYNEEESLTELSNLLEKVLSRETKNNYEVLFIDDGSTDSTFSVMREINKKNPKFKAIRFRRNYGKSAALSVGFKAAKGAVIITMDADLQDDPMEIPNLMSKIRDGYDLVSGWKKKRNDPINKTLPSKFFNYVTAKASGLKLHDFNCGLKAYRSEAAKSLDIYGEMHRYLPVLAHWNGFRITEIPVKHHPRKHGKTKFGASRYVKGFLDLITLLFTSRYLKRPLHFFGTVGTLMGLVGFGIDAWLTVEWIMGDTFLSNRPAALLGIALIIVGVQLVSLGLLGEMIVKNFKRDEEYQIRENL